ncbi:MAG TPA: OsmC family protein [Mycobacteriales bacterium]
MDMRSQDERAFRVDLHHLERYRFTSQASEDGREHGRPFESDEPDPVGDASAPATPALLGAAVGHCLSASLLEALRHAHVPVRTCDTEVTAMVRPNADGLPRIDHVDVVIRPVLEADSPRTGRCEEVFERHCTVTSSVRTGIDIRVRVDWDVAGEGTDGADGAGSTPVPASVAHE